MVRERIQESGLVFLSSSIFLDGLAKKGEARIRREYLGGKLQERRSPII